MANQKNTVQAGLNNNAYNLVTILENKAKAVRAYDAYKEDAEQEGSPDCAALIERIQQDDLRHIEELKQHVPIVLGGGKMNAQQSAGSAESSGSAQKR